MPEFDAFVHETGRTIAGRGTVDSWNTASSPRMGVVVKLDADGRTMLRANAGRFSQGLLTGEISGIHPGRTKDYGSSRRPSWVPHSCVIESGAASDPELRVRVHESVSIGLDREVGGLLAVSVAYVRKDGRDFIGWKELAGEYRQGPATLNDGRVVQVWRLTTPSEARLFQLTNPEDYSLTSTAWSSPRSGDDPADGRHSGPAPCRGRTGCSLRAARTPQARRSRPWRLAHLRSRQESRSARIVISPTPTAARPTMPAHGSCHDVVEGCTGFVVGDLQDISGKPWAHTALINPNEGARPIMIEPRGTRRLSSQTLLDVRVSRPFHFTSLGRVELCLDVLNAFNDTAAESIRTEVYDADPASLGQPNIFIDPRRAMLSVRLNLGR